MAQKLEPGPLQITHGHTEDKVIITFTRATDHVLLTPAQAEAFIASMQQMMKKLAEHQAAKRAGSN